MKKLLIVGVAAAFSAAAFAQNIVSDPGFEDNNSLSGTAWTVNNASTGSDWFFSTTSGHNGPNCIEFGAVSQIDDTIVQTLTTVAGQNYTYSFWFNGGGTPEDLNVFWNGSNIFSTTAPTDHAWTQYSFNVQATGTSTQIGIGAYNSPSFSGLDDVSVVAQSTPEPASMAVLGLGALALIRRRRNRKA